MPRPALLVLSYLPAFQLVARYLSIKRAAQELHLTPSAVSQQIHALEKALGIPLFRRMTRALALTPAGERFAGLVSDTLEPYQRGTEQILRQYARRELRLTTDPFVAHEILIPALHTFSPAERAVVLRIEAAKEAQ